MGTQVALFGGSALPAFAQKRELSDFAKSLAGGGGGVDRISIAAGVFRLVVGGKEVAQIEERYLDVVIINAAPKNNRVWYAKKFDPESPGAPDCWSADGDTPSPDAASPQASRCADCPQNVKGSGEGDSRACRFQRRVAVVLAHGKQAVDEEGAPTLNHGGHGPLQIVVPAKSLFGQGENDNRPLQEYARYLAAIKVDPDMLVTRMRFDTKADSPKLWFKPMRWLTDEEYAQVKEMGASEEAARAVTVEFGEHRTETPTPALPGTKPTAKAKPAPAADDDDDEDAAPPVKKGGAKAETAATKTSLAQAVSDWDDD